MLIFVCDAYAQFIGENLHPREGFECQVLDGQVFDLLEPLEQALIAGRDGGFGA